MAEEDEVTTQHDHTANLATTLMLVAKARGAVVVVVESPDSKNFCSIAVEQTTDMTVFQELEKLLEAALKDIREQIDEIRPKVIV